MKARLQAFSIHILLSALVLSGALALVALVWYPAPLFWADGGREVIQLIAFVDVVLGPSLTLIVYQKGKKSLKFDLAVIATIQLAALIYGGMTMYWQRPVFVAFAVDKLYTVSAEQVESKAPKKLAELGRLTAHPTNWVYVALPQDVNSLRSLFLGQGDGELVLSLHSDLYQPLEGDNLTKMLKQRVDVAKMIDAEERKTGAEDKLTLSRFLDRHRVKAEELAFIPFVARYQQMFAAYRLSDAKLLGYLEIAPDLFASGVK